MLVRSLLFPALCLATLIAECKRTKRAVVGPKWNTNTIAYELDSSYEDDTKELIHTALKEMSELLEVEGKKCLEFVPRIQQKDFISFRNTEGCSSFVGYTPGANNDNHNSRAKSASTPPTSCSC